MADNTAQNGTDTIATDDIGGVKFQRIKLVHGADGVNAGDVSTANALPALLTGNATGLWPNYTGPDSTAQRSASVDDDGSLQVRAAVLTDEGTFRCNFANSSLFVGIGSVTVSGSTVTGTGFLAADVHRGDYFKISADADTFCQQIESIDSDTQISLKAAYTGTASGTGNRALLFPYTGSGSSQSVASGALTLTAGTTASAITGVKRFTDYGPLVFRARVTVSQRIANQEIRAGLAEDVTTPRWFARFKIDGTTNTTVTCETGRNPTGAPSASETQSSTVTLPNGATTATARDYRVELLTESVRFYVDGVLLAEHANIIPHQHDEMTSLVEVRNGTTPASSTTVTVDYITGKNHNKLEVGVMSDAEKIVATQPAQGVYTYSQTGVIAINTDLLVLDCSQIRAVSIHCISVGTSGTITCQASNDGVNWLSSPLILISGSSTTTLTAGQILYANVSSKFIRLRLTAATTAGTTSFVACAMQHAVAAPVVGVGGSVTANIGTGALAAGTNAIGDVGIQARASSTGAMTTAKVLAAATTNATSVKASAGRVLGWALCNTTAAVKVVRLYNLSTAPTVGTSVPVYNIVIPANGYVDATFPAGISHSTGIAYAITNAIADLDATAVAANDVIGAIFYA